VARVDVLRCHFSVMLGGMKHVHAICPHSHDHDADAALESSAEGMRALRLSLVALALTACAQLAVVALSGSVALLGDALHNAADALTAVPLGVAFVLGRRPPTRRYARCWAG